MDDLIAFVTARLDEDERELVKDPPYGLGYANLTARMRREIEAKRALLDFCATVISDDEGHALWSDGWAGLTVARRAVRTLATTWSDHPDYDQEWKP